MTRAEILAAALQAVTVDRAATHGSAERNFALIGQFWSAYTGANISATDVAAMLALFKLARIKANPAHMDSWTDLAGYSACGGEVATINEGLSFGEHMARRGATQAEYEAAFYAQAPK